MVDGEQDGVAVAGVDVHVIHDTAPRTCRRPPPPSACDSEKKILQASDRASGFCTLHGLYCFITRESICLGFSYPICEVEGSQRGGAGDPEPVGFAVRIPFHNTGTHVLCAYKKKDVPLSAGAVWRGLGQQRREVLDAAGALPSNTPTNRAVVMRRPATSGVSGVLTSRAGLVTIVTRVHSRCLTKCMSQK